MEVRVEGKVALITGASRGIGEATAAQLLASGAAGVTITSRKEPNITEAARRLNSGLSSRTSIFEALAIATTTRSADGWSSSSPSRRSASMRGT